MIPRTGRAHIQWYGARVSEQMRADLVRGLRLATTYARKRIVTVISRSSRVGAGSRTPGPNAGPPMRFEHSRAGQPPRADTGKLRQSIYGQVHESQMLGEVGTTKKYGAYLEKGTRPHTIVARRKQLLAFGVNGVWVFKRRVRHPGMKPRPYIFSTVKKNRRKLMALIVRPAQGRMRLA